MASRKAISKLTQEVFGYLPNKGIRTGNSVLKKRWTGLLEARYYPDDITDIARKVGSKRISLHLSFLFPRWHHICVFRLLIHQLMTNVKFWYFFHACIDDTRIFDGAGRETSNEIRYTEKKRKGSAQEGKRKEKEISGLINWMNQSI